MSFLFVFHAIFLVNRQHPSSCGMPIFCTWLIASSYVVDPCFSTFHFPVNRQVVLEAWFDSSSNYFRVDFFLLYTFYCNSSWGIWLISGFRWTVENFNTSCSATNIISRPHISKGKEDLKNSVYIFNTMPNNCRKHLFFPQAHIVQL